MTFGRLEKPGVAAVVAEFLGTGVLTLAVLSVHYSPIGVPFFVALAAGLAVAVMSFALAGTSGAYFNPALALAMWTARRLSTIRTLFYIAAQLLGAYAAYSLYHYFVNTKLQNIGGHYTGRILVGEAVGAGVFAFGWAAAAYQSFTTTAAASVAGLAYIVGILTVSSASLALLNPALALGVKAWVWGTYVLGPILGAVIGTNLYSLLFAENAAVNATVSTAAVATSTAKKPATRRKTTRRTSAKKK